QNIRLFGAMTATENVMIGHHARMRAGLFGSIIQPPRVRREERQTRERARELLDYVGLREAVFDRLAPQLSHGGPRRGGEGRRGRGRRSRGCCCSTSRPPA